MNQNQSIPLHNGSFRRKIRIIYCSSINGLDASYGKFSDELGTFEFGRSDFEGENRNADTEQQYLIW